MPRDSTYWRTAPARKGSLPPKQKTRTHHRPTPSSAAPFWPCPPSSCLLSTITTLLPSNDHTPGATRPAASWDCTRLADGVSMSVGLRWPSAMRAEVTAGADGKRYRTAKRGMSPSAVDPPLVSAPAYLRFVRYAEVLIDVRAHTETIVNSEQTHIKCAVFFLLLTPIWCSTILSSPPITISRETRSRLIKSLDSWHFEPHKLPEEEVLSCTYILFEALFRIRGMQEDVGVSLRES